MSLVNISLLDKIDLSKDVIRLPQGTYILIEEYDNRGNVNKSYDGYYSSNEMLNSRKNKIILYRTRDNNGTPIRRNYVLDPNNYKAYYFNGDFPPPLTYGLEGNGTRSGGTRSKKRRRRRTKRR
jgi:hypothetical protein